MSSCSITSGMPSSENQKIEIYNITEFIANFIGRDGKGSSLTEYHGVMEWRE